MTLIWLQSQKTVKPLGSGKADKAPNKTPLMPLMPLFLAAQGFWGVAFSLP